MLVRVRDGCGLYASAEGQGDAVFFIAGLGGSAAFWSSIVPHFKNYRIVLMDHRGAGRSERPEQKYTVEQLAQDACDALDHFGIARAHIVGHSTGGAIGQVMAIDHARYVNRLVLGGTWAQPDDAFHLLFKARRETLLRAGVEAYAATTQFLGYSPDWIANNIGDIRTAISKAGDLEPLSVTAARIDMVTAFDRSGDLYKIAKQTLVLGSESDIIVPFRHSRELTKLVSGARLASMPGGHFFPRENPAEFARIVQEFLKS
jgi:aminoacrylate hydrolase